MSTTEKQRNKVLSLLDHPEEYPGLPIRRDTDRRLLIFRYPSFEPYFSWSLFYSNKTYWIRRVGWDPSKCFPSENAEPLTFGSEVVCPNEVAETLLSSLATISIRPLQQPKLIGMDGTICGIVVGNYWLSCAL
ncbi:MAG: hypothetical protein AAGC93_30185 [Cyanobacteria bacterium P01_F01_bin.53]